MRAAMVIQSADTVHGSSTPALHIALRVTHAGEVTAEFDAPPVGRDDIKCSEFCGGGHGQMRARW